MTVVEDFEIAFWEEGCTSSHNQDSRSLDRDSQLGVCRIRSRNSKNRFRGLFSGKIPPVRLMQRAEHFEVSCWEADHWILSCIGETVRCVVRLRDRVTRSALAADMNYCSQGTLHHLPHVEIKLGTHWRWFLILYFHNLLEESLLRTQADIQQGKLICPRRETQWSGKNNSGSRIAAYFLCCLPSSIGLQAMQLSS